MADTPGFDVGSFPKEMVTHITNIYHNEYIGYLGKKSEKESQIKTLYDIMTESWKRTLSLQNVGGTRCTMMEIHPQEGSND